MKISEIEAIVKEHDACGSSCAFVLELQAIRQLLAERTKMLKVMVDTHRGPYDRIADSPCLCAYCTEAREQGDWCDICDAPQYVTPDGEHHCEGRYEDQRD